MQGKKPMRFVFFLEGNGLPPDDIQPVGVVRKDMPNPKGGQTGKCNGEDAIVDLQLSAPGHSLPLPIAPLARHTKRLTLLQGLSGRVCGGGALKWLRGARGLFGKLRREDITIDAAIARPNPAIFQHLALGLKVAREHLLLLLCVWAGPEGAALSEPVLAYKCSLARSSEATQRPRSVLRRCCSTTWW